MASLNRRDFMTSTAAGAVAASVRPLAQGAPAIQRPTAFKPVVISSANGHQFKNGGAQTCVEMAFERMTRGGDVLDALVAGVNVVELDPLEDSVGYGGLPNADGIVQLDSCCMGRELSWTTEVEAVHFPHVLRLKVADGPFTGTISYQIQRSANGSVVRIHNDGQTSMLGFLPASLIEAPMRSALTADLARLKDLVEGKDHVKS